MSQECLFQNKRQLFYSLIGAFITSLHKYWGCLSVDFFQLCFEWLHIYVQKAKICPMTWMIFSIGRYKRYSFMYECDKWSIFIMFLSANLWQVWQLCNENMWNKYWWLHYNPCVHGELKAKTLKKYIANIIYECIVCLWKNNKK